MLRTSLKACLICFAYSKGKINCELYKANFWDNIRGPSFSNGIPRPKHWKESDSRHLNLYWRYYQTVGFISLHIALCLEICIIKFQYWDLKILLLVPIIVFVHWIFIWRVYFQKGLNPLFIVLRKLSFFKIKILHFINSDNLVVNERCHM